MPHRISHWVHDPTRRNNSGKRIAHGEGDTEPTPEKCLRQRQMVIARKPGGGEGGGGRRRRRRRREEEEEEEEDDSRRAVGEIWYCRG